MIFSQFNIYYVNSGDTGPGARWVQPPQPTPDWDPRHLPTSSLRVAAVRFAQRRVRRWRLAAVLRRVRVRRGASGDPRWRLVRGGDPPIYR